MASTRGRGRTSRSLPSATRKASPYERIKQAILSGELEPGQQLVEAHIAEWCEVSRTPVREALTRLQQDGLVGRGDRGLVVRESSPDEILDLYETRIVLEATAARFAADRRTDHDLRQLRRVLSKMAEVDTDKADEMAAVNAEFHQLVWRASHNGPLVDLLERLTMHLGRYPATTLAYPGRWDSANAEHAELLEALEARDSETAARIATEHFTEARDIRLKLWENQ
jgi:DNA-binding GntR family transcriptional regulator